VTYRWHYLDAAGDAVPGPAENFPDQAAAEEWLGQCWQELRDSGVDAVSLFEDRGRDSADEVYGPMSLHER
jgi:hypothetical protein